jgi:tetratricopeptide (TPR) repeat protein
MQEGRGQVSSRTSGSVKELLRLADRIRTEARLAEAEALCRQALEAEPNLAEAENLLGIVVHQKGDLGEAITHVRRAAQLQPNIAIFHANLAEMERLSGRPALAAEEARRALAIEPNLPAALSNLGVALYELKQYEEAASAHRRAIIANPGFAEAHSNLGNALYGLKRFEEAVAAYRQAITLRPDFIDAWANLGTTLHHAGALEEGAVALRRAIVMSPDHANARSGLGMLLLMRGDFAEGWEEYEWRLRSTERKGPRFPTTPWTGGSLIQKHIYVQAEQGFGDTLQFARYMPLLATRARKVTFRVHQQLASLFAESFEGVEVLGDRADVAPYDCDVALLSLPYLFKTRLETVPAQTPYLRPPADVSQRWRRRLGQLHGLKVGLAWRGNAEHVNDHRRSIKLATIAALTEIRGVAFVSLQVGEPSEELRRDKKLKILDLSPKIEQNFAETAGAVANLDLIITVDTSLAHLAGALARPVWVLLPSVTDWRWLLNREDSPWYPTMRLFRQMREESMDVVIARVALELKSLAQGDAAALTPFRNMGESRAAEAAAIIEAAAVRLRKPVAAARTMTNAQALMLAEQKRREGLFADAEDISRRVLSADENNGEALHLLGVLAHQSGKTEEAIAYLRRSVKAEPSHPHFHANLGEVCRLAGQIDEAIAAGRRALELKPDYPEALSNVGIALFEQGKFEEALSHYERAITIQPAFAQAHSNMGNALQRLKRFAEAEVCYRRAIDFAPRFGDAWSNLGTALRELGRPDEAESAYRKALELKPNDPDILDSLALALKDLDRIDEALDTFKLALSIENGSEKIYTHFGATLLDHRRAEEAVNAIDRALALNKRSYDAINLMGRVDYERGNLEQAIVHHRRALEIEPDLADAHSNLGNAFKALGRMEEAHQAYRKALEIDPENTGVYLNLADLKTFGPGDPDLLTMDALKSKTGLSGTHRLHLDFALAKAYGDLKDLRRALEYLFIANAAKRARIDYDERREFELFERIERTFTPELIEAKSNKRERDQSPIFIIGMPRSGTTLVEQILAAHPYVFGAGELATLSEIVQSVSRPEWTEPYPSFAPMLDSGELGKIGSQYVARLHKIAPSKRYITDKMPSNYYFAGLIHLALPNAKIIHSKRNPIDTCVSCFSKLFSDQQHYTYDLGELGRYYKRYERLMAHWRRVLPKGRMLDVIYEDVVDDVERQARRILDHCGLPWDERCLAFHRSDRAVRTASAVQVRKPIYRDAVGRWRGLEDLLAPLLIELDLIDH